jgi:hypothetical protein
VLGTSETRDALAAQTVPGAPSEWLNKTSADYTFDERY